MPITHPPCIEVNGITFAYDGALVLDDVTFAVAHGDSVGIIGPNGSGKTTLLKIILGLLQPTSGTVSVFGKTGTNIPRHEIGYVPQRVEQELLQFPATVEEIVVSGRTPVRGLLHRLTPTDRAAVEESLAVTGLAPVRHQLVSRLSGGQRQRAFIARALAGKPHLLILDEPTVGVDIASREQFYSFLQDINQRLGITVVIVSHDTEVVAKQVNTVLCLNKKLVCHVRACDISKGNFLEELYGENAKLVVHHLHDH